MRETRVASRYAKSLLGLASEKGVLENVYGDMQLIDETVKGSKELSVLLKSPIIKSDKKQNILSSLFTDKVSEISNAFMKIIVTKGREYLLGDIAEAFIALYKNNKGIITAELTSVVALDKSLKEKIVQLVNPDNKPVELIEKINKDLIGGFVVRVDDKQIDASVLRKISDLKQEFSKNPYVVEL